MSFRDRQDAGLKLAEALRGRVGEHPLVLGIPRGGVVMAAAIADALNGDLDVMLVHKLGAPLNPEVAVGAMDENGDVYLNELVEAEDIGRAFIEQESREQLAALRERRARYTPIRTPIPLEDREVILVDDGLATGATMMVGISSARRRRARRVIVATAVAPRDTAARMARLANDFVCLETPPLFYAVGQFFDDFAQVSDEEVETLLRAASTKSTRARG